MLAMNLTTNTGMKKKIYAFFLCGAAFFSLSVFADQASERTALAKLIQELDMLTPLIESAEAQADPDARIRFQYAWLRHDVARVRQGIAEHLETPQSEPRRFPPLHGDYRR